MAVEQDLLPELEAYLEGPPQAPWDSIQEMTRVLGLLQWSCGEIKRLRTYCLELVDRGPEEAL